MLQKDMNDTNNTTGNKNVTKSNGLVNKNNLDTSKIYGLKRIEDQIENTNRYMIIGLGILLLKVFL